MIEFWHIASVFLCVFIFWLFQQFEKKKNKWPPGPVCLPGIGSFIKIMLTDGKKPYHAFYKLAKTYGDVMSIQLGTTNAVIISGYETCKTVLHSDQFLARFAQDWLISRTFGKPLGILFGELSIWRESRRFTVRNLREFGFGKKHSMESIIVQEIQEFTGKFPVNTSVNMHSQFDAPVINSVFAMLCGFRFDHNDEELQTLLKLIHEYFASIKNGADVIAAFPFLKLLIPNYHKQQRVNKAMQAFFRKIIKDTRNRATYKDNPESFLDVFLSKIDTVQDGNKKDDETEDERVFTDENLISILYDFFVAGAETTSTSIEFLILYLILNPEIQEKLANEVHKTIGNRWPSYEDKEKLPYVEAVILETLRIATVLPLGPRKAVEDIEFGSYRIPKDTFVAVSYYSVHMDEAYWKDPEVFRPERFIDANGKLYNTERLMPFSLGKRNCIGESLARMNIFLFTTRLFQTYKISADCHKPKPSTEPLVGITMAPQPYNAVFQPR